MRTGAELDGWLAGMAWARQFQFPDFEDMEPLSCDGDYKTRRIWLDGFAAGVRGNV